MAKNAKPRTEALSEIPRASEHALLFRNDGLEERAVVGLVVEAPRRLHSGVQLSIVS